jgi:hypothetical protein
MKSIIKWLSLDGKWICLRDGKPDRCCRCERIKEYDRMAVAPSCHCKCNESEMLISPFGFDPKRKASNKQITIGPPNAHDEE